MELKSMKKYSKIKRLGHERTKDVVKKDAELILKEKLDGANFRATVVEVDGEYKWLFGSRNVEYKKNGEPDYSENVDGRFVDAINEVRETINPEWVAENIGTEYTFFFENMVKHSLDYPFQKMPQVIGFDIYNEEKEKWMRTDSAYFNFEAMGFETSPVVDRIPLEEFEPEEYEIPESNYRDGKMEGVVIINPEAEEDYKSGFNTRAKMVTEEFAEKHKKATGARQSKEAIKGHEKIVSKFCTDARIEKHIHKMRDEGRELGMELMGNEGNSKGLPIRVAIDILEEEAYDIVNRNDEMNWKNYRSLVADRCVHVLRQEIQKEAGKQKAEG